MSDTKKYQVYLPIAESDERSFLVLTESDNGCVEILLSWSVNRPSIEMKMPRFLISSRMFEGMKLHFEGVKA